MYMAPNPPQVVSQYNGINPHYPGVELLHNHPPVYAVTNFLTPKECEFLIQAAEGSFSPAPVVGKGVGEVSESRTSSTCYLAREDLPDLMRKVSLLTGKPIEHCELPQVGRYLSSQQYYQVRRYHNTYCSLVVIEERSQAKPSQAKQWEPKLTTNTFSLFYIHSYVAF